MVIVHLPFPFPFLFRSFFPGDTILRTVSDSLVDLGNGILLHLDYLHHGGVVIVPENFRGQLNAPLTFIAATQVYDRYPLHASILFPIPSRYLRYARENIIFSSYLMQLLLSIQ